MTPLLLTYTPRHKVQQLPEFDELREVQTETIGTWWVCSLLVFEHPLNWSLWEYGWRTVNFMSPIRQEACDAALFYLINRRLEGRS